MLIKKEVNTEKLPVLMDCVKHDHFRYRCSPSQLHLGKFFCYLLIKYPSDALVSFSQRHPLLHYFFLLTVKNVKCIHSLQWEPPSICVGHLVQEENVRCNEGYTAAVEPLSGVNSVLAIQIFPT